MKPATIRRALPVLLLTTGIAPTTGAKAAPRFGPHGSAATGAKKYKGPSITMRWGPVQVTVAVKGSRITNVTASAPTDRTRSVFINGQALPLLRQEVLQAQSASVSVISGATMTSHAYIRSLQGALRKAHL